MTAIARIDLDAVLDAIREPIAATAGTHDADDSFAHDAYALFRKHRVLSAGIPLDAGGGGASYEEVVRFLRKLAHSGSSAALSLSMHTHVVLFGVWSLKNKGVGPPFRKKVAEAEACVVTSGGRDLFESNGRAERVDGGYHVWARKAFASGTPAGAIFTSSVPFEDPETGWRVLHFALPFGSEGISVDETWKAHGMRATGSHDVVLDGVFVPDGAVALDRPRHGFHPIWQTVITLAIPVFMGVYVGVAERAAELAVERAIRRRDDRDVQAAVGAMLTELRIAQMAHDRAIQNANGLDFAPSMERASEAAMQKTLMTKAATRTVELAMEAAGGAAYFRDFGLERLLRDVRGAVFHPLPERVQARYSGAIAMGIDPVVPS